MLDRMCYIKKSRAMMHRFGRGRKGVVPSPGGPSSLGLGLISSPTAGPQQTSPGSRLPGDPSFGSS